MACSKAIALALAALALAACADARAMLQASSARWCVPAAANSPAVAACTAALASANTAQVSFTCVAGGSEEGCLKLISEGGADLITLGAASGAQGMLTANEDYKLEPIAAEFYGGLEGANYYAVAVVPAAFCTAGVTLADLKGKRACHTGYRRTAGWTMPIGYMIEQGVMPVVNSNASVNADAQSAASFFSAVCAPSDDGALASGGEWAGVCSACKENCSPTDPYADYAGTLRCVMEGAGDVAFTKHITALEVPADGTAPEAWSTMTKDELRLLCPAGGCAELDDFKSCNIATSPAYAVMTRADFKSGAAGKAAQAALVAAAANATFLAGAKNVTGIDGFLFTDDTEGLLPVNTPFIQYFGANTKAAFDGIQSLDTQPPSTPAATPATPTPAATPSTPAATPSTPAPSSAAASTARWCIPFAADATVLAACNTAVAKGDTADVKFECVTGGSDEACLKLIQSGGADLLLMGGSDMLPANENYGLEAIAAEYYGDLSGASYYSVAVVPAAFCRDGVTFADLKGKRSCHTGYRRTAGWTLPVGTLVSEGVIPRVDADDEVQADAESVAAFFSATCAPGSTEVGPRLGGATWDKMCTACKGDCTAADPYADYAGTLRCVMEGAGDVAFTKHTTALEVPADGTSPEAWSSMKKSDLRLLCPTGGCAELDDFERCNVAKSPARAVMARADMQTSAMGKAVKSALTGGGPELVEALTGVGGQKDFIFGETATGVLSVDVPFTTFFGATTKAAYESIANLDALAAAAAGAPAPPPAESGGGGVSSGAAAGIGVGCAVAGAALGAAAMAWFDSRRKGWKSHDTAISGGAPASDGYKL